MLTALEKRVIREQVTMDSLFKEASAVMACSISLLYRVPVYRGEW